MNAPFHPLWRTLFRWVRVFLFLVSLLIVFLHLDNLPAAAARPPESLKTIEDFRAWKHGLIKGQGTFEAKGVLYTVMLAPASHYLASGPSAYLFDPQGQFVDWTGDMGDYHTVKHRFNLTGSQVKNLSVTTSK